MKRKCFVFSLVLLGSLLSGCPYPCEPGINYDSRQLDCFDILISPQTLGVSEICNLKLTGNLESDFSNTEIQLQFYKKENNSYNGVIIDYENLQGLHEWKTDWEFTDFVSEHENYSIKKNYNFRLPAIGNYMVRVYISSYNKKEKYLGELSKDLYLDVIAD